jgi:ferritin-like metal-binding protein YciE
MTKTIDEQLTSYLTDAHSIEEQALAQLRSAPQIAGATQLARALREHLPETEEHERLVHGLLAQRDASPSWFKDAVMRLGGKGFILFARASPDTPGKLLAHALSFEALEEASYDLLELVALAADESHVAETASRIASEEMRMQSRLLDCLDDAVAASLAAVDSDDPEERLRAYLADAHAIEMQAIELLERAAGRSPAPLAEAYQDHLVETRDQAEAVAARLRALGGDPSTIKDTAMRAGALNWALFFEAHPDTEGKLVAFAYAFEHLEIGGYEQLKRVAELARDGQTAQLAERILTQERNAATTLKSLFPQAAEAALEATGARPRRA